MAKTQLTSNARTTTTTTDEKQAENRICFKPQSDLTASHHLPPCNAKSIIKVSRTQKMKEKRNKTQDNLHEAVRLNYG
jgi:hypothetical protein